VEGGGVDETMTDDAVLDGELSDESSAEEPVLESLIEEISIDGMCGVY
jgi:mycofactocin precursor